MAATRARGTSRTASRCSTSCSQLRGLRFVVQGQLPQPDVHHQPELECGRLHAYTCYDPLTGAPFEVYARRRRPRRDRRSLDTFDPERRQYESMVAEFGGGCRGAARCSAAGASSASGSGPARRPTTRTTCRRRRRSRRTPPTTPAAPSATTSRSTSRSRRASSCLGLPLLGHRSGGGDAEQREPEQHADDERHARGHAIRPTARRRARPARSSCRPASSASRRSSTTSSRRGTFVERITQLDFKVSRTFQLRPRRGAADARGVQRQQLGRDHQLRHDQRARRTYWRRTASCKADGRFRRDDPLVRRL